MTELHPVVYDLAPSVAGTIYRRYKNYVERDDIRQECMAWAMTRNAYITEQLNEPNEERRKHNEQRIAYQMRRVAERYARKEKASKSGYQTTDEAYYESPEGKAELEAARLAGIKEAKRLAKVQKRWQWLHDKLAAKGCECNHDDCGGW